MKIRNATPLGVWTVSAIALELSRQSDGTHDIGLFEQYLHRVTRDLIDVEDELKKHYKQIGEEQAE